MSRSEEFAQGHGMGGGRTWREDFPEHDVPREISGIEGLTDRSSVEPEHMRPHPIGPQFMRDWGKEGEESHHRVKVIVAHPDPERRPDFGLSEEGTRYRVLYHTNAPAEQHAFPTKYPKNPGGFTDLYEGDDPKEAARTTINAVIQTHRHLRGQ